MRKALMGLILAATAMSPVAANAQDWHNRGDRGGRGARSQNEGDSGESRETRSERHQRQEAQQAPQPVVQPAPQPQVVERQRGGDRGNWRGGSNDGNRGDDGNRRTRTNQGSIYPQAWQGDPNSPMLRHYQQVERQNQQRYDGRRDDGRNWRNDRTDRRDWRDGDRRDRRTSWNRSWRNDNRYDWQRWRYSNRNIFHIGRYYSPYRNYGYNRFSIGLILDPLFFGRDYWIGDPWQYRLPPAPPGTQWIRYYDDVLLVDVYSGEVLDAIYDFFW
jgi:hypothetical protein